MAEKDITTWEEFKNALTESITEDTTYNIKNDLDASNDILTNNIECISPHKKIFMGNDYKINAITAYGNVTVFNTVQESNYNYRFYNIKFTNFMIESGTFTTLCRNSYYADFEEYSNLFLNCFFNGVCKKFSAFITSNRLAYFNKCSFNVRCESFSDQRSTFDSCYIIITPLQNTNSFSEDSTIVNSYVEGVVKNNFSSRSYLTPKFSGNNVFNCKVIITNYDDSITYEVSYSDAPVLVNKSKLLQSDGITPISHVTALNNNIYFLTDEQMKNKEYIQQNTKFPLYG